jgi:short-subunit dehydrogenase
MDIKSNVIKSFNMKKAIVIGATSGLGWEIASNLVEQGWTVGIAGRREELLDKFIAEHSKKSNVDSDSNIEKQVIDVTKDDAASKTEELINKLKGMDLFVNVSGVGFENEELNPDKELKIAEVNSCGFIRMVDFAFNWFKKNSTKENPGPIAIISSIAGTKGLGTAPAYSATKRMQNTYIESLSQLAKMKAIPLSFTDIRPGFTATDILSSEKHYPLLMNKKRVGKIATKAILNKRRIKVIDWKFAIITFFWRLIPRCVWERMTFVKN